MPLRLNDPVKSAIVVIMQRLHVDDVSGIIEKLDLPYIKVMLPMEFEIARRCVTPIAHDPRRMEGELLFPKRFPREVVERDKVPLGPNGMLANCNSVRSCAAVRCSSWRGLAQ